MSYRKLLVIAALVGLVGSAAACADATGPQEFCQVTGGGQTCEN